MPALQAGIDEVFDARIGDVSGRGKLAADMREIWMMQPRFEKRTGSTPFGLVEQPRFRAGFDFMRLRADAGEVDVVLADWWQEFSIASDAVREDLVAQVREETQGKGARRVRAPRPPVAEPGAGIVAAPAQDRPAVDGQPGEGAANEAGDGAPRKRRRRRRKPGGGEGGGGSSQPEGNSDPS